MKPFQRSLSAALLIVCPWVAAAADPQRPAGPGDEEVSAQLGDDLRVEEIAVGVWRHVSVQEVPDWGPVPANGLVVLGEHGAALVDTPWTPSQTERLMAWVEQRFGVPVRLVVPTHAHADCSGGLAAAHAAGATSWALEETAKRLRAGGEAAPEHVFTGRERLPLDERELVLLHPGAGHTADNIVVYVPDVGVLFGGCLVKDAATDHMGNLAEADVGAWPDSLEVVRRAFPDARLIVPGHGDPGGWETVENTERLLAAQ